MNEEEEKELQRQSLLLESLAGSEAFRIWRAEVCDPLLEQIKMLLANSDQLSEPILRANVKLEYLVRDMFYTVFDRVKQANDQERELTN